MTLSMGTPEIHNFVFRYHTLNTIDCIAMEAMGGQKIQYGPYLMIVIFGTPPYVLGV